MMRAPLAWLIIALAAALASVTVYADGPPSAVVRVGTHQGYSRVAFNFTTRTEYAVTRQGDQVAVRFADNAVIGAANAVPRHVVSISGGLGKAEIVIAKDATIRDWRVGNLVVTSCRPKPAASRWLRGRRRRSRRGMPRRHRPTNMQSRRRMHRCEPSARLTPSHRPRPASRPRRRQPKPSERRRGVGRCRPHRNRRLPARLMPPPRPR